MFDRQTISSLLTLIGGVAASVMVIAMQPDPVDEPGDVGHAAGAASVALAGPLAQAEPACLRRSADGAAGRDVACDDNFTRWARARSAP